MRLFLKVHGDANSNNKSITLWFNERIVVSEVKLAIYESGQTAHIPLKNMELRCGDRVMLDTKELEYYGLVANPIQVHAVLIFRPDKYVKRKPSCLQQCVPVEDARNVSIICSTVKVMLNPGWILKDPALAHTALLVRSERNNEIRGRVEYNQESSILEFIPSDILCSNAIYTVYFDAHYITLAVADGSDENGAVNVSEEQNDSDTFIWSFTTQRLAPIRILVTAVEVSNNATDSDTEDGITPVRNNDTSFILTHDRQSPALLDELRLLLARQLQVEMHMIQRIEAHSFDGRTVDVERDSDVVRLSNSDCLTVTVDRHAEPPMLETAVPVPDTFSPADWQQYYADNWVNDASGYLAIGGKMSAAEEEALICSVVEAFSLREDNSDGIAVASAAEAVSMDVDSDSCEGNEKNTPQCNALCTGHRTANNADSGGGSGTETNSNSNSSSSSVCQQYHATVQSAYIPSTMRTRLWLQQSDTHNSNSGNSSNNISSNKISSSRDMKPRTIRSNESLLLSTGFSTDSPTIFTLEATSSPVFLHELRNHGFTILRLPPRTVRAIEKLHSEAKTYFDQPLELKECHRDAIYRYLGHINNKQYSKEFYQLRRYNTNHMNLETVMWPKSDGVAAGFKAAVNECHQRLYDVCRDVVSDILTQLNGGERDEALLSTLFEPPLNDSQYAHQLSLSNMTVFRYNAPLDGVLEDIHCPYHSDVSLLTVIPLYGGNSGLHMYDWQSGLWVDVCQGAPPDCAVVFTGELMGRLTGNYLLPTMHEVSGIGPGPRISTPLQFCAAADAVIDPLQLKIVRDAVADGTLLDHRVSNPCRAGEFVDAVSASRFSSNFVSL